MNRRIRNLAVGGLLGLTLVGGTAMTAGADSSSGRPQTQAEAQARKAARFSALTDEQRQCLTDAGVGRPSAKPTPEQFQALRQAATDCGIQIGGRGGGPGAQRPQTQADGQARMGQRFAQLSDEQRQCLTDAGVGRPSAKPTPEQFQALRQAAADCGIATGRPGPR